MNKEEIAKIKRVERTKRNIEHHKAAYEARQIRREERRCFWTWPWGHLYPKETSYGICTICGHYNSGRSLGPGP